MPNFWEYVRKTGGGKEPPGIPGSREWRLFGCAEPCNEPPRNKGCSSPPCPDGFRQCRNAVPPSCSGPSTTAFCDGHFVCACIYVQLIPMLFRATLARRVRLDLSASILTACCHNESRGRVRGRGRDGVDSGLLPPVLFSFNAAKSGRCLQRKIKVPRFLAVCLSAGFLFLALLAFSFFLLPSSASFPSSLSSSTCIRIHYESVLWTNRIK